MDKFFLDADRIFSDPNISSAFALYGEDRPSYLAWGEGRSLKNNLCKLSYRSFFYPDHGPASDLWKGFAEEKQFTPIELQKFSGPVPPMDFTMQTEPKWQEDEGTWLELCGKVRAGLDSGSFQKIVPSRSRHASLTKEESELIRKNLFWRVSALAAPGTFRFALKSGSDFFFGATPELLFQRRNGKIIVPAIAGTLVSETDDPAATESFLRSEKEREEHAYVVDGIFRTLGELGLNPQHPMGPEVRRFGKLLHLYTPIHCADPGSSRLPGIKLLEALHPTAAIGGSPKIAALRFLRENENWNRGLFSSPMLFSLPKEELCLVAIRSGLLRKDSIHFFAGAGFVKGSDPQREWTETENKMNALSRMFFQRSRS